MGGGGGGSDLETADKENKYLNRLNMRMSKYGQNQFRPSAVINSMQQANNVAATSFSTLNKADGGIGQGNDIGRPVNESLKMF